MDTALSRLIELNRQPHSHSPLVANRGSDSGVPGAPGPQGNAKAKAQSKGMSNALRRGKGGGDAPPTGSQQEEKRVRAP